MAEVELKELIDALEMVIDEHPNFFDRETGKVEMVEQSLLSEAEDLEESDPDPDVLTWQEDEWEIVKLIAADDGSRFVQLPNKHDIHEWEIMREFAESREPDKLRRELLDAIHGTGAFRMFKHCIRERKVESDWYEFRTAALRKIAIEWCEENDVKWR